MPGLFRGEIPFLFRFYAEISGAFAFSVWFFDLFSYETAANKFANGGCTGRHTMLKTPIINDLQLLVIEHDLEFFCSLRACHVGFPVNFRGIQIRLKPLKINVFKNFGVSDVTAISSIKQLSCVFVAFAVSDVSNVK